MTSLPVCAERPWDIRLPKGSPRDEESSVVASGEVIFPDPFARHFSSPYTSHPLGFHINLPGFAKQQARGWPASILGLTSNKSELSTPSSNAWGDTTSPKPRATWGANVDQGQC